MITTVVGYIPSMTGSSTIPFSITVAPPKPFRGVVAVFNFLREIFRPRKPSQVIFVALSPSTNTILMSKFAISPIITKISSWGYARPTKSSCRVQVSAYYHMYTIIFITLALGEGLSSNFVCPDCPSHICSKAPVSKGSQSPSLTLGTLQCHTRDPC